MKRLAQDVPQNVSPTPQELTSLRNSIVEFQQNMKIAYNKLKLAGPTGTIQQALLSAYKPYLENIAAAPVFGSTFTTAQLNQQLRYLQGIVRKFASTNATMDSVFSAKYNKQPYYQNLLFFGNKIKELFTPLATGISSTLPDDQLISKASAMANLLDKVGSNFVSKIASYLLNLGPQNNLGRVVTGEKISMDKLFYLADQFNQRFDK